jgi:nucleoside-diphosphate-sugar epimerase
MFETSFLTSTLDIAGVVHVASNTNFSPKPDEVVPVAIKGAVEAIKAAAKQPSVKRFVLTSSSRAAFWPHPNEKLTIGNESYDTEAVEDLERIGAKDAKDVSGLEMYKVYSAGKTLAELEVWKWYKETKPDFILNTGTFQVQLPLAVTNSA